MGAFPRLPTFRGVGPFLITELRVQLHENMAVATSMTIQAVLLIFVTILAPQYLSAALVGAVIFSFFTLGQRVWNEAAYVRIDHRLNQLYGASPLAPEAYFLGMAGGVLVAYLPPILILVAVAEAILHFSAVSALTLALTAGAVWLFAVSFGYVVSTVFRDMRTIWPYSSLFYNLFGILPPVFYPYGLLQPASAVSIALALPPSAATGLIQNALAPGLLSSGQVLLAAGSLVVESTAMFVFAVYWSRRSVRER
jgi:ABC-2 type transport system permease protein